VTELYGLADVFVHAATEEAFGLAICEAAASGTMVLVHNSPHFQWLVGDSDCLIDMNMTGALAEKLSRIASQRAHEKKPSLAAGIRNRFDWDIVAPRYIEMYRNVAGMEPLAGGSAM
jgi:glycosyltransferase involved in cell wall biosynthesis